MNQANTSTFTRNTEVPMDPEDGEQYLDHPDETRDTMWKNPTDHDVVMDLHIGTNPLYGNGPRPTLHPFGKTREQRLGVKQFVVKAGQTKAIPSEFDVGIQHRECRHPDCTSKKLYCLDKSHPSNIVGGLGPQLINLGMKVRPRLSPALDAMLSEKKEIEAKAIEAFHAKEDAERALQVSNGQLLLAQQKLAQREAEIAAKEKAFADHSAREKDLADREAKLLAKQGEKNKG